MRVVAGKYKRRQLESPPGDSVTRPTSDRVKENAFNILAQNIADSIALDLFAGSGALGIEALSRGAKHCIFVEKDKTAIQFLTKNLSALSIPNSHYTIVSADVVEFLKNPSRFLTHNKVTENFAASISLVFADPPYASDWYNQALMLLKESGLCASHCLSMIELPKDREVSLVEGWELTDERKYGITKLQFWELLEGANEVTT